MKKLVNIYIINTDTLEGREESLTAVIPPLYVEKYNKAKQISVQRQELGAGYLLSKVLGITKDGQLMVRPHGKVDAKEGKHFNISHADNYVVLAVCDEELGVDIERIDRLKLNTLKRVLPADYYADVENADTTAWGKAWTEVEAILKASGEGFTLDPRNTPDFMDGWFVDGVLFNGTHYISIAMKSEFEFNIVMVDTKGEE
jgi:4'-phosphopantetheinyl transferase